MPIQVLGAGLGQIRWMIYDSRKGVGMNVALDAGQPERD